jgi:hypothetical protein
LLIALFIALCKAETLGLQRSGDEVNLGVPDEVFCGYWIRAQSRFRRRAMILGARPANSPVRLESAATARWLLRPATPRHDCCS